ncbi:MAG: hypothetical protein ACPGU3_09680 [Litorivicinus sp.]
MQWLSLIALPFAFGTYAASLYEECTHLTRSESAALERCITQGLLNQQIQPQKTQILLPLGWASSATPPLVLEHAQETSLGVGCVNNEVALCWDRGWGDAVALTDPLGQRVILKGHPDPSLTMACMAMDPGFAESLLQTPTWQSSFSLSNFSGLDQARAIVADYCVTQ